MAAVVLLGLAWDGRAGAADVEVAPEMPPLEVHGFASQGFIFSTGNDYLAESTRGSFEFSEVGINFTMQLGDRLRTGMQIFARDLGPIGDYKAVMDWYHVDYRWRDFLGVRAGRVKLPFGLYNDVSDIDAARNAILLPQSIYPTQNRDFLLAQTGVELYGYLRLGSAGALDYRLNGGTIFLDPSPTPGSTVTVLDLTIPFVVGGRVLWELPIEGLRVGGSVQALRLDTDLIVAPSPMPVTVEIPAVLWVASAEYLFRDLLVAAEYSRWHIETNTSDQMRFPDSYTVSERAYLRAAYRVGPRLQPGVYYSIYFPDVDEREGRAASQHDVAATLRYDVTPNWIVKLEGHFMHGTAGASSRLNDGTPLDELEPNWGVFLIKTTAFF